MIRGESFNYAVLDNRWLWGHMLLGALGGKFLTLLPFPWLNPLIIVALVFVTGLAWEIGEWFVQDIEKTYGTRRRFVLDALGDIVGEVLMALLVVI